MAERMPPDDRAGLLETLLGPLMLPRRAVRELEALGAAARSLPGFERTLMDRLEGLSDEVGGLRADVNGKLERVEGTLERLDAKLASVQAEMPELAGELVDIKERVVELRDRVDDVVEHLPDPDGRGPLARARDAVMGSESSGGG